MGRGAWWAAIHGVAKSQTRLSDFTFTFHFHALEKEMATHSSVLALRIPGTGEPGGLLSMGSHRAGHDWSHLATMCNGAESGINITIGQKWGLRGSCDPQSAVFWCPPPTPLLSLLRSPHKWGLLRGKGLDHVGVLIDRGLRLIYNFYICMWPLGSLVVTPLSFHPHGFKRERETAVIQPEDWKRKCVSAQPSLPSLSPGPGASWWTVRIVAIWDAHGALFNHQISRSFFKIWVCPRKGWMCEPHSSCVLWEVGKESWGLLSWQRPCLFWPLPCLFCLSSSGWTTGLGDSGGFSNKKMCLTSVSGGLILSEC